MKKQKITSLMDTKGEDQMQICLFAKRGLTLALIKGGGSPVGLDMGSSGVVISLFEEPLSARQLPSIGCPALTACPPPPAPLAQTHSYKW